MPADASHTAPAPTPSQLAQGWLRDAPADLLAEIAPSARLITYPDGECIHPHGGPAQGMFLILRGRVRISRTTDGGSELVYGMLRAGEWFGEIALIDGGGRTHSAHAQGPTTLILLGSAAFARVVSAYPAGMWALMQQLCQRIRLIFDEFEHASEMPASPTVCCSSPARATAASWRPAMKSWAACWPARGRRFPNTCRPGSAQVGSAAITGRSKSSTRQLCGC